MSVEISSDILAVREKCLWNFYRRFACQRKMSFKISRDILPVREKMSVETSSDILALFTRAAKVSDSCIDRNIPERK